MNKYKKQQTNSIESSKNYNTKIDEAEDISNCQNSKDCETYDDYENHEDRHNSSKKILWKSNALYDGYEYYISQAKESEIDEVCEIVSAEEILEIWHLFRMPTHDALQKTIEYSRSGLGVAYTLYRENTYKKEIIGMGGVVPLPNIGNSVAEVWCIGADMEEHTRFVARHSRDIMRMFFEKYPVLINVVGTWNKRSIRWLKYVGFFVEEKPEFMGMNKALFHRFYMTKQMFDAKYYILSKVKM